MRAACGRPTPRHVAGERVANLHEPQRRELAAELEGRGGVERRRVVGDAAADVNGRMNLTFFTPPRVLVKHT